MIAPPDNLSPLYSSSKYVSGSISYFVYNWKLVSNNNMQYTVRKQYDRKVWKSCAQLGCTVDCGKFKPVHIVVIDKTDSLAPQPSF